MKQGTRFRSKSGVPSANRKIVEVANQQGVQGMQNMQGTTRIIYDAILLAATTTNTTVNLFENCKTRQFPLTNLTENKLQVGEAMALQRFSFYIIQCTTGTTNVLSVQPIAYFPQFHRLYGGVLNFTIAQDTVIKKLPLASMYAPFNPDSRFQGLFQTQPLAADPVTSYLTPQDIFHFDTDIILLPQLEFVAQVQLPPIALPAGSDFYLAMKLEGIGSLYNPKSTF